MEPDLESLKAQVKARYGDVHTCSIGEQLYIFRPLSVEEIMIAKDSHLNDAEIEDYYVSIALVYPGPEIMDKIKAGYITQLADAIMYCSGITDPSLINSMLERHRDNLNTDLIAMMKTYIIAAMPSYTEEDLNVYTMIQLTNKVVLAENIISLQQTAAGMEQTGLRLFIRPIGAEDEPASKEDAAKRREKLIKQIRDQNQESYNLHTSTEPMPSTSDLEQTDTATLERMLGIAKSDDPIARKLAADQSKVEELIRSITR